MMHHPVRKVQHPSLAQGPAHCLPSQYMNRVLKHLLVNRLTRLRKGWLQWMPNLQKQNPECVAVSQQQKPHPVAICSRQPMHQPQPQPQPQPHRSVRGQRLRSMICAKCVQILVNGRAASAVAKYIEIGSDGHHSTVSSCQVSKCSHHCTGLRHSHIYIIGPRHRLETQAC